MTLYEGVGHKLFPKAHSLEAAVSLHGTAKCLNTRHSGHTIHLCESCSPSAYNIGGCGILAHVVRWRHHRDRNVTGPGP